MVLNNIFLIKKTFVRSMVIFPHDVRKTEISESVIKLESPSLNVYTRKWVVRKTTRQK